jgi:hypothetical protein
MAEFIKAKDFYGFLKDFWWRGRKGKKGIWWYMTARVILCVGVSLRRHVVEQLQKKTMAATCLVYFKLHISLAFGFLEIV